LLLSAHSDIRDLLTSDYLLTVWH